MCEHFPQIVQAFRLPLWSTGPDDKTGSEALDKIKASAKYLLAILFLVSAAGQDLFSQETIEDVVNKYGRIDSIFNVNKTNLDSVIVLGAKDIWTGAD